MAIGFWLLGVVLAFTWGYILNLLVFRTERTGGLIGVADVAAAFLAGGFVPLDILPLHGLWLVLPFRFAGWFPAQIFSGRVKFAELPRELGLLLRWLLLLPLIRLTIWQLGLRRCRCSKPSTAGLIPLPAGAGGKLSAWWGRFLSSWSSSGPSFEDSIPVRGGGGGGPGAIPPPADADTQEVRSLLCLACPLPGHLRDDGLLPPLPELLAYQDAELLLAYLQPCGVRQIPHRGVSRCDKGPSHHGAPVGAPLPLPGDGVGGAWRHGTPRISARGTRGFLFLGRSLWRAGLRRYRGAGG